MIKYLKIFLISSYFWGAEYNKTVKLFVPYSK